VSIKERKLALITALQRASVDFRERLDDLKAYANDLRRRPDLVWLLLIQSAATHGSSRGWEGLRADRKALASIRYSALAPLQSPARRTRLLKALKSSKVRMPNTKANSLARNVTILSELGGVHAATNTMLTIGTRDDKVKFITQFYGIGEKYGRNIWMDIYDPAFRNSVAVDARLKKIAAALGYDYSKYKYEDYERLFVAIASEAGIEPWAVDRLLYMYTEHFMYVIQGKPDAPASVA